MPTRPCALALSVLVATAFFAMISTTVYTAPPSKTQSAKPQIAAPKVDPVLGKVDQAIRDTSRRFLNAEHHSPWQIMHGMLAFRSDFRIRLQSEEITAVDWLSRNPRYKGEHWFEKTPYGGRAHPFSQAYYFEGHPNQFLAVMSISNLPLEHKIPTQQGDITVSDMVNHAKANIKAGEEVAWSLWGLSHYLGADAKWENMYGEPWGVERLARIQINEPTDSAACGGTHGLFGLTYARNKYKEQFRQLRGIWLEADQHIKRFMSTARSYQNSDGTFSTQFFKGHGVSYDFKKRVSTSGHTLEFLTLAASDDDLKQNWIRKGVDRVAQDLIDHRSEPVECGPLYHAINGLVIYRDRVSKPVKQDQLSIVLP